MYAALSCIPAVFFRPMSETKIGGMSVDALVTTLASDAITPGSGAAGALDIGAARALLAAAAEIHRRNSAGT